MGGTVIQKHKIGLIYHNVLACPNVQGDTSKGTNLVIQKQYSLVTRL